MITNTHLTTKFTVYGKIMYRKTVIRLSLAFLSALILIYGCFFHKTCLASEDSSAAPAANNIIILQTGPENTIKSDWPTGTFTVYRFRD